MANGADDSSWLDNFGYGGITARALIPRYASLHDFLGVGPDDIPSLPFNSSSWREQLPSFSYQATADSMKMEALHLACGLRKSHFEQSALCPPERRNSQNKQRGFTPFEIARDDIKPAEHRNSFSSCKSQEDGEEESATPPMQMSSGGSTTAEIDSATTDSSDRSNTGQVNGLRDDRLGDDIHDSIISHKGADNYDVDAVIGGSSSSSHARANAEEKVVAPEEASATWEDISPEFASSKMIVHGRSREEWSCSREEWWDYPHSVLDREVRYLENARPFTRLLCMKNMKEAHRPESRSPWLEGRCDDIYEQMGILDPSRSYVAFWLGFGHNNTVLFTSEVVDRARLDSMLTTDCMKHRLKLLLHPVRVSLPFPAKAAKDADTVGAFFGSKGASIQRFRTRCGADVTSVQIDLFSKWLLKMAMTKVGMRETNILEAVLVDWLPDDPAVLTAGRINATEAFVRHFYA